MLVLTRKAAETIQIGDSIVIKVIKTGRGTVKIGIDAPDAVRVVRGELLEAAASAVGDVVPSSPWLYAGVQSDQFPHVV